MSKISQTYGFTAHSYVAKQQTSIAMRIIKSYHVGRPMRTENLKVERALRLWDCLGLPLAVCDVVSGGVLEECLRKCEKKKLRYFSTNVLDEKFQMFFTLTTVFFT